MPKRSNSFQRLIAAIEGQLAPLGAVVTESKLIKEKSSDTEREVDVAIESHVGQHRVLVAVECRDRSRPANLEWIDGLIGKYRDLPVEKVVAVSRSGFTKTAIKKAKEVNISTVTLEAAIDAKLIPSKQGRTVPIEYETDQPPNLDITLHREDVQMHGRYTGDPKKGIVYRPDGRCEGPLVEILKSQSTIARTAEANIDPRELKEGPLTPITIEFPKGTKIVDDDGKSYRIRKVRIEQSVKIENAELKLDSFRYMDVELLAGRIDTGDVQLQLLLLYQEGADVYSYQVQAHGALSTELQFGDGTRSVHPRPII
jgi:hypothetical protein